jgi:hypothetical protein
MVSPHTSPAMAAQANSVLAEMVTYMKVRYYYCSGTLRSQADLFYRKLPRYADLTRPLTQRAPATICRPGQHELMSTDWR